MKYSIVLPCYNELYNIPVLVECFRKFTSQWNFELIMVNNGSTDNSDEILTQIQADPKNSFIHVVTIEKNIGYGHGIHTGLLAAQAEILAYSHADVQTPPADIFHAFELIESGQVDILGAIIKGRRPGRDMTHILTRGLRIISNFLVGISVEDINGQPKVFHRSLLQAMSKPVVDFAYDAYVLHTAKRAGLEVKSIDVRFEDRLYGQSKWSSTILNKYKTILTYLKSIYLMSWRDRRDKNNPLGQLYRFLLSGVLTNLSNYLMFLALLRFFLINYLASSIGGFFSGFIVGFFLNKHFTFGASGGKTHLEMINFFLVNLFSLGANVMTIFLAVEVAWCNPEIGQIFAILVSATINFVGLKCWVFARVPGRSVL